MEWRSSGSNAGARAVWRVLLLTAVVVPVGNGEAAEMRQEWFDREPGTWEGVNNRSTHFRKRVVSQDFGYNATARHTGTTPGEVGGSIYQAGEAAYYGYRLPAPLALGDALSASGKMLVKSGAGHFLLGFFNSVTLNEWRTPNTLAVRVNARGKSFHCHIEYCSSRWRADAGVVGTIVPGERVEAKEVPCDEVLEWELNYEPNGGGGNGALRLRLGKDRAECSLAKEHRQDGATFTHFGLLPVLKTWDSPGEIWINEVTVNGRRFDFKEDPGWEGVNNRRTYETGDTRPRFDFGWSPTHHAGGRNAGEIGGQVFRGDCREAPRLAAYGDRLALLDLNKPLRASGRVAVLRAVSDSTASIGFYSSVWSLRVNPAQNQAVPSDYLGVNIEGPSSEGFFFYPVCRAHEGDAVNGAGPGRAPRIYPDGKSHRWMLEYDPQGAEGNGRVIMSLDDQSVVLDLDSSFKKTGAAFDRFGICTPWIDGNSVTVYFDDLEYTRTQNAE